MRKIIPAILATTIEDLNEKLEKLASFSDEIQIDIMDGEFVLAKSFDIVDLMSLPEGKDYEFHLMVAHPLEYMSHFKRLGIKKVVFHDEIDDDTADVISKYKAEGIVTFLAIKPEIEPNQIEQHIPNIDGLMLMSVEPGKSGQALIESVLVKAKYLREKHPNLVLEIDGGVNRDNLVQVFESGINIAAIGSGILKAENPELEWDRLLKFLIL